MVNGVLERAGGINFGVDRTVMIFNIPFASIEEVLIQAGESMDQAPLYI